MSQLKYRIDQIRVPGIALISADTQRYGVGPTQKMPYSSQFNEITWFFPSTGQTENDSYVTYNVLYNEWDVGKLSRSAWVNQSIFGSPLAADTSGYIYQHD